jgi:neutral/alkaline ceramidase-like enzyme
VRDELSRARRLAPALLLALVLAAAAPAAAQPCPECLQAGAARVALRVPAGTPLAGYGSAARRLLIPDVLDRYPHAFWFQPSEGERDPVLARALVLEAGGRRLAWVTLDLLAVDRAFTTDVERRLAAAGVRPATLVVSASHTHSGPGAFVDSAVLGWVALDRLDRAVRDALLDGAVAAVRQADAARQPARVALASVTAPPIAVSRLRQPLDPEILVLRVSAAGGAPIALLWNYAIHGTMLSAHNLRVSADVMGEATAVLERELGAPALFVNGAVGDVSPAHHGDRAAHDVGVELAAAVRRGWSAATVMARPALASASRAVALPAPRLSARNCLRGWAPRALTIPVGSVFPRETTLTAVAIGEAAWVAFPGELQTRLGRAIKAQARPPLRYAGVAGVSNDYLGYFVGAEEYARPGYVTCASLYGPRAGECLTAAAGDLLSALRRGEWTAGARVACDRDAGGG